MKTSEIKALGFKRVEGMGWVLDCPFPDMPKQEGSALPPSIEMIAGQVTVRMELHGCTSTGSAHIMAMVLKKDYPSTPDIIRRMYDAWKAVAS